MTNERVFGLKKVVVELMKAQTEDYAQQKQMCEAIGQTHQGLQGLEKGMEKMGGIIEAAITGWGEKNTQLAQELGTAQTGWNEELQAQAQGLSREVWAKVTRWTEKREVQQAHFEKKDVPRSRKNGKTGCGRQVGLA